MVKAGFRNSEWIIHIPEQPVQIFSDRELLTTVLDTLLQNSLEAIGSQGTIVARLCTSQSHCEITIQDTGNGLSVENRQHAMDPFYSGRDAGRGIGLGLCKANHFAHALQGELSLNGQTNSGCIAKLILPIALNTSPNLS
ncbi:MAG UNVERIFIED_CONTAM: ATP-binding protein [Microcystis novacekii LVE1205-3]